MKTYRTKQAAAAAARKKHLQNKSHTRVALIKTYNKKRKGGWRVYVDKP